MSWRSSPTCIVFFFFQAEDGIRDLTVTGVQTCALPISDLAEETSINWSGGLTWRPLDNLSLTADAYRITIDGRIVITSQFARNDPDPAVRARVIQILTPFQNQGVTTAQFFTNALNTRTHGLDVVAAYATRLASGTLSLTASASFTKTQVERANVPEATADTFSSANLDTVRARILNREDRNRLEDALPRAKSSIAARYTLGRFGGGALATDYGAVGNQIGKAHVWNPVAGKNRMPSS